MNEVLLDREDVPSSLYGLYYRVVNRINPKNQEGAKLEWASEKNTIRDELDMTLTRIGPYTICELFYATKRKHGYGIAIRSYEDKQNQAVGQAISFTRSVEDLLKKL